MKMMKMKKTIIQLITIFLLRILKINIIKIIMNFILIKFCDNCKF